MASLKRPLEVAEEGEGQSEARNVQARLAPSDGFAANGSDVVGLVRSMLGDRRSIAIFNRLNTHLNGLQSHTVWPTAEHYPAWLTTAGIPGIVRHVILDQRRVQVPVHWPRGLLHLRLFSNEQSTEEALAALNLPDGLISLGELDQRPPPDMRFPASLETIEFGYYFNKPVDQLHLPASLKTLFLGVTFNRPVDQLVLPDTLTTLRFGRTFNQRVDDLRLPASLTSLTFGDEFNQPVDNLVLPASLVHLEFGCRFAQSIKRLRLPPSLRELTAFLPRFGHKNIARAKRRCPNVMVVDLDIPSDELDESDLDLMDEDEEE